MKKRYLFLAILAIMCLILVGCGNNSNTPEEEGEGTVDMEPITWTAVTHIDTSSEHFKQEKAMCDAITERTGGLLTVELYSIGEFAFSATDLVSVVADRTVDLAFNCTSYIDGENSVMSIVEWPMLCSSNEDMAKAFEALEPYLKEDFDAKNQTLLDWWSTIGLGFYGNGTPVDSLDDFNGRKIRFYSDPMAKVMQNYGIVPVSMTIADCIPAMQRGVVDGAITGNIYAYDMSWYDICDWAFIMNIAGASNGIWVNNDAMAELPEEVQQIVQEEAHNYHDVNIEFNESSTQKSIDGMAEKGCVVNYCSDEDYEQAAIYAVDVWNELAAKKGERFERALADVRAALGK